MVTNKAIVGLVPKVVKEVFSKIKEINEKHKTAILVVEHNIKSLLEIAHRAYVLDKGKIVANNTADKILKSGVLEKIFMGEAGLICVCYLEVRPLCTSSYIHPDPYAR